MLIFLEDTRRITPSFCRRHPTPSNIIGPVHQGKGEKVSILMDHKNVVLIESKRVKARFSVTFTEEKIAGKVNHVSGGSFPPALKH